MKKIVTIVGALLFALLLMPLTFALAQTAPAYFPSLAELRMLITHPEGTAQWGTHVNKTFRYKIGFPASWRPIRFFPYLSGFQPPSLSGKNVQWAVLVIDDKAADTLDKEIAKMGTEFKTGRSIVTENIVVNDMPALKVTARSLEKPDWQHIQVFIKAFGKIYILTNGGIENPDFELFYSSFRLIKE